MNSNILSIVVLITVIYVSAEYPDPPPFIDRDRIADCQYPSSDPVACGVTFNWEQGRYMFEFSFNPDSMTCQPVYGDNRNVMCHWLRPLARTKRECEDNCGEPCYVYFANKTVVSGVCMDSTLCLFHDDELDHTAIANDKWPCNHGDPGTSCCPRDHHQDF